LQHVVLYFDFGPHARVYFVTSFAGILVLLSSFMSRALVKGKAIPLQA